MFTFNDTSDWSKPSFRFSYDAGLVTFNFDVTDPTSLSLESYQDLANAVLVVTRGKTKPRHFSYKDSDQGQFIKLIAIDEHLSKVEFRLYNIGHALKITLPFEICEQAFKEAAAWRATIANSV